MRLLTTKRALISYLFMAAIIIPCVTAVTVATVSASPQPTVSGLRIFRDSGTGNVHTVRLLWDAVTNAVPDFDDNPDELSVGENFIRYLRNYTGLGYGAQGYDLSYENATKNNGLRSFLGMPEPPSTTQLFNNITLDAGSLYSFKVTPYHYHPTPQNNMWLYPGTKITPQGVAPPQAFLLTNLEVDASYEGDTLTVTWDNPTYGPLQTQVFPYFRIYVAPQPTNDTRATASVAININANECAKIPANPATGKGPRLSYQIKGVNTSGARIYNVAVEPCDSERGLIRTQGSTINMMIGGILSSLTFSPYQTAYEKQGVAVPFEVTLRETGSQTGLLEWGDLASIANLESVAIFASVNDKKALEDISNGLIEGVPVATFAKNQDNISTSYPVIFPTDSSVFYMLRITAGANYIFSNIVEAKSQDTKITPNAPAILDVRMPEEAGAGSAIEIFWEPFLRQSYKEGDTVKPLPPSASLNPDGSARYDSDVTYDFWITDDISKLPSSNYAAPLTLRITANELSQLNQPLLRIEDGKEAYAFTTRFPRYFDSATNTLLPFKGNKLYYIEVKAKKLIDASDINPSYNESESSFATIYIPIEGDISTPPMLAKPPLSVKKDENGNELITTTSIDVTWLEKWTEIFDYSRNLADAGGYEPENNRPAWQTIAVKEGSNIFYGMDTTGKIPIIEFFKLAEDAVRGALGITDPVVPVRTIDIAGADKNIKYELRTITFESFTNEVSVYSGDYQRYLDARAADALGANGWIPVTPDNGSVNVRNLTPNTSYAIMIRGYRTTSDGQILMGYANFLTATTAPTEGPLVIKPTPPRAEADADKPATDTSVSVKWDNTQTLEYEVLYSDVYYTNVNAQQPTLNAAYIAENSVLSADGKYRHLTVGNLMPDTEYYVWVRARHGNNISSWSSAVYLKTAPMDTPRVPRGFGVASSNDLGLINLAAGSTLKPLSKDAIVVQWFKDAADPKTDGTGANTDFATVLAHPELTQAYTVMFNNLISNKPYYFRAKTIATISRDANRATVKSFSYLIQMSTDTAFVEVKEIYVPAAPPLVESENVKQAESEWTQMISFTTSLSDDDYDSNANAMTKPLPEQDFEIFYNAVGGTLTYRFRSNEKDENGNNDNMVDQRFISRLVSQNVHNYDIDVSRHGNSRIQKRVVEVPYSLIKTFAERKINFGIQAGNMKVTLSPETMNTSLVGSALDYGANAKLQIVFTENPTNKPSLPSPRDAFSTTPQEVAFYLQTQQQYIKMPSLGKPMAVSMSLSSGTDALDKNIGAYVSNSSTNGWSKAAATYSNQTASLNFTAHPGTYAVIEAQAPQTVSFDQSTTSMLNVASSMAFTDLSVYNGNHTATSNQLLNVMNAIVKGESRLAVNATPDAAAVLSLQRTGINVYANAASVSREQAIAAMVRIYEIKTKRQIKPTYTLATTPYSDTRNAHVNYHNALLKAAEIDMLNGAGALRPKSNLTLGELLELADVIISDAGL